MGVHIYTDHNFILLRFMQTLIKTRYNLAYAHAQATDIVGVACTIHAAAPPSFICRILY